MGGDPVGTISDGSYIAEIFSTDLPGEYRVVYKDSEGRAVEEVPLTGISSYHQREKEIRARMRELRAGTNKPPYLGDAGEY